MAYVEPTPTMLKERFPAFSEVPDTVVKQAIDEAHRMVDKSWCDGDYTLAIILAACHIMAMDGLGNSPEANAIAKGTASYQTIKSGQLTLTRGDWAKTVGNDGNWWAGTSWGRRFYRLLVLNKRGPRVAVAGTGSGQSGYAKDVRAWTPWGRI